MRITWAVTVALCSVRVAIAAAQIPDLPSSPSSHWSVSGPDEVVSWLTFDPATVQNRLPASYRFVIVGELAAGGVSWARDYLSQHEGHAGWGVSFLEIMRADSFVIDNRQPRWSDSAAVAVWFARVLPKNPMSDSSTAMPFLVLEFWVPDSSYVVFMRSKGYFASYAAVNLIQHDGVWHGTVRTQHLAADVTCKPVGAESGGPNSRGKQMLIPPASSGLMTVVNISFAGHRERQCVEMTGWRRSGSHPLTRAVEIASPSLQYGYRLIGGVYPSRQ